MAVVLGTGDLTNWARPGEYERLAELLAPLTVPFLALPGNHDDRDLLRATFPTTPWIDAAHASWVTTVGAGDERVRIVGLDSTSRASRVRRSTTSARPGCVRSSPRSSTA